MDSQLSEIVVLRPTRVFFSFLASQLPESYLPSSQTFHSDNTAYLIKKHHNKEATLDELEHHFSKMFRYEIRRWLGAEARNSIEKSFIDFLCCFKLEFHSHFILLEPTLEQAKHMVLLKPRMKLLQWLNSVVENHQELATLMQEVTLSHLCENATAVLKNFNSLQEIKPFLSRYYPYLYKTAMSRLSNNPYQWPKISSYKEFSHYFEVEIHTQLITY